ncbi:hypothetical protein ACFRJ9_08360 [Paenarthrobacter sp. NPDC056912]|uniref:hypothetical protein n=1 Tax=Paenarthrobacter sp. NPDC056912 TaxID=3345965 RepID=UPI00366D6C93
MSYDVTVYGPGKQTLEPVLSLLESAKGLEADSSETEVAELSRSIRVNRGVKQSYCFTVDGPFETDSADVPAEVISVLPNVVTMFQVLVEGTSEAEIPHGVRFARKLAKHVGGVVFDEQTAQVWPLPKPPRGSIYTVYPRVDAVEFAWYCLADEMPGDLPQKYLALARELLPLAVPGKFGTQHPPQWDLTRDGDLAFSKAWQEPASAVSFKPKYPVTWVSLSSRISTSATDVRTMRMTIASEALLDESFRTRVREFFIRFAEESRAFHAAAEVLRDYTLERKQLVDGPGAEEYRLLGLASGWVGLKPHSQWWMWFGPHYADAVRPHLSGHLEEYPGGLFHSWAEAPANRDMLTALLSDSTKPWIPAEYSPVYQEGVVSPLALASNIPQRLQESRVEPHVWTD